MLRPSFRRRYRKPHEPGVVAVLKNGKYVAVGVILALTLLIVLFVQSYESLSLYGASKNPVLDQSSVNPSPAPVISTAKPSGVNVSVIGKLGTITVAPACSLSYPPCAITNSVVYYMIVNGRNYRLIFTNTTKVPEPLVGSYVVVTGLFVTPSAYRADQYTPLLHFFGDIHVQVITYFHTLPGL